MQREITINPENRLIIKENGNETVLTDEQCATIFDPPGSPGYDFTLHLFKTNPNEAKQWLILRLKQVQFIRELLEHDHP